MKAEAYPHITRKKGVLAGIPIIVGSRTPVRSIAAYYQLGMTADDILHSLPHLTLAQVHAALTYYFDHQAEIDRDLARNADIEFWKKQAGKVTAQLA